MSNEPAKDAGDVRPSSLNHLIGQDHVREVVRMAINDSFCEGVAIPHMLCNGPAGTGKTAICQVISAEAASTLHTVLGSALSSPSELYAVLMKAADLDVIFIDEIHELDRSLQHILMIAIDERKVYLPNSAGGSPLSIIKTKGTPPRDA